MLFSPLSHCFHSTRFTQCSPLPFTNTPENSNTTPAYIRSNKIANSFQSLIILLDRQPRTATYQPNCCAPLPSSLSRNRIFHVDHPVTDASLVVTSTIAKQLKSQRLLPYSESRYIDWMLHFIADEYIALKKNRLHLLERQTPAGKRSATTQHHPVHHITLV